MRVIKTYTFKIGTKIPFSQWPDIIHQFLDENNLKSHRFLYYFQDFVGYSQTFEEAMSKCGCARILRDCPALGEIQFHNGKSHGRSDTLWLSNIDSNEHFEKETLLPLINKIYRRYGFADTNLYYFDIDFFGKKTTFERDYSTAERICKTDNIQFDPTLYMEDQPYGSGIVLHRDVCADNYIELSVDILHDDEIIDPSSYYESLQNLLPKIKTTTSVKIYLTDDEKKNIEATNRLAAPVLQKCNDFLTQRIPSEKSQNYSSSNYSIANSLKKLAKKYGYTYKLVWNGGSYSVEKRTDKGNVLYILVDSGPSHYSTNITISYQGIGFKHILFRCMRTPNNQEDLDSCLKNLMSIISEFENDLLHELDNMFPETPDWFIASE